MAKSTIWKPWSPRIALCPSRPSVRVRNLANDKTVEVRIIDRGPFVQGRIIDLSHAAAKAIDLIGPGVGQVEVTVIATPANPNRRSSPYRWRVQRKSQCRPRGSRT